jgi:hypothetical protein
LIFSLTKIIICFLMRSLSIVNVLYCKVWKASSHLTPSCFKHLIGSLRSYFTRDWHFFCWHLKRSFGPYQTIDIFQAALESLFSSEALSSHLSLLLKILSYQPSCHLFSFQFSWIQYWIWSISKVLLLSLYKLDFSFSPTSSSRNPRTHIVILSLDVLAWCCATVYL